MPIIKSVLLGIAAFALYTVLYLWFTVHPTPHMAVGLTLIAAVTVRDFSWWAMGVVLIVLAYALLKLRQKKAGASSAPPLVDPDPTR
jgi:hypothetical protein